MTFLIQSFQICRKRFVTCLRVLVLFVLSLMYLAISSLRPEMFNLSKLIINFKNCIQIKSSKNCGAPSRSPSRVWNLKRVPRWQFSPQMTNFWGPHVVVAAQRPSGEQMVSITTNINWDFSWCVASCLLAVVDIVGGYSDDQSVPQTTGRQWVAWWRGWCRANKTTNNNILAGSLVLPQPSQAVTVAGQVAFSDIL